MKDLNNAIVHFEIPADDVDRAINFYKTVFGWTFNKWEMPADSSTGGDPYYGVCTVKSDEKGMPQVPGAINGGLMKRKHPQQPFMNYISVTDMSATLEKLKAHGATIVMPKTEIAQGMGWIAAFKDTENNLVGLHQEGDMNKQS